MHYEIRCHLDVRASNVDTYPYLVALKFLPNAMSSPRGIVTAIQQ